jgi:endonuclease G
MFKFFDFFIKFVKACAIYLAVISSLGLNCFANQDFEAARAPASPASVSFDSEYAACKEIFPMGTPPRVENPKLLRNFHALCFLSFALGYSGQSKTPLFSAEHLSAQSLRSAKGLRRVNAFHEEERLPAGERSWLRDYAHSGFDRGHMSPSADQPSEQAQQESFSLANMVPQNPNNNRQLWEGIESAVRTLTKKQGELYVLTGPLFLGSDIQQIGGRVMVPTHLFKLIYDPARAMSAAYLVKNIETSEYQVVSASELQKISGIDFLPALTLSQKKQLLDLPAPTPHQNTGEHSHPDHSRAEHHQNTDVEFRQVEHLLREFMHLYR